MEKTISLYSQVSQVCNDDSKCMVCRGIEDPNIVVLSQLTKEKNFIKLICNRCIANEEYFLQSTISQASTQDSSQVRSLEESSQIRSQEKSSQVRSQEEILTQNENVSAKNEEGFIQIQDKEKDKENEVNNYSIQNQGEEQKNELKEGCSNNEQSKSEEDTQNENNLKVKQQPAFIIEPHHIQIQFDDLISQFETSLKTQKFELLHRSTELTLFLKSALRVIYEIQGQVENMQEDINKAASKQEDLIYQLKQTDYSIEKQNLLSQIVEFLELKDNKIIAQIQQRKFTQEMDDIKLKLEFLSESLEQNAFEINSQIYQIKKQTVQKCNEMLAELKINGKWKQYSDIQMDLECMSIGMRGVYRYSISQNGQVSQGTSTGYVYLRMDTTENYSQYTFYNLTPLYITNKNQYFCGNNSSRDPIAKKLGDFFLSQRNKIIELQQKLSRLLK